MTADYSTLSVHAGFQGGDPVSRARAVPIATSTAYFEDPETHAQLNPTVHVLEERITALTGGISTVAVSSGVSAISLALFTITQAGDNFVSASSLYGGTYNQFAIGFERLDIHVKFAKGADPTSIESLIDEKTKAIYVESICNPGLGVPDLAAISNVAKAAGIPLIVDNTFGACSYLIDPIKLGADIVVQSATKWIGGHGVAIGGVVTDAGRLDWSAGGKFPLLESYWAKYGRLAFATRLRLEVAPQFGTDLSAFNAFLLLHGLETISLRVDRQCSNALALALWLQKHPNVSWVVYPGLPDHPEHENARKFMHRRKYGSILTFGVRGGREAAKNVVNTVKLCSHMTSVGDNKTLVTQPATTTHHQLSEEAQLRAGVTPDMIRVSVGIENILDIQADLDRAMSAPIPPP
ncbi:hypothetical protein AeNC1_008751 [Aphanomyces euteiches]|nr:hypothetical protein AeNC1_008751 [Aphanomyces euteiches]